MLRCTGLSLCWLLLLRNTGSRRVGFSSCGSQALERRLSSCGAWAQLFHSMWDLPRIGIEPVSPALAGGFLTTEPPGKPFIANYNYLIHCLLICLLSSPLECKMYEGRNHISSLLYPWCQVQVWHIIGAQ